MGGYEKPAIAADAPCKKYRKNPSKPVVGLPLASRFNEVLTLDIGELEGDKFVVIVDWATRYCQAK